MVPILLPAVMPDETISSYVMRVGLLADASLPRTLYRALFGAAWRAPHAQLPTSLHALAAATACVTLTPQPEHWLTKHTLFPYFASVATPAAATVLATRMLIPRIGPVRPVHALTTDEWRIRVARTCHECMAEDLRTIGFTYIRRRFMIPYVSRCTLHGARLIEVTTWTPVGLKREATHKITDRFDQQINSNRFAKVSEALLFQEPGSARTAVKDALRSRGFLTKSGRLRAAQLSEALRSRFDAGFDDDHLNNLVSSESGLKVLTRCFGNRRKFIHPVAAVLLLAADSYVHTAVSEHPAAKSVVRGRGKRLVIERTNQALQLIANGTTLSAASAQVGISVTTLTLAARRVGLSYVHAPRP